MAWEPDLSWMLDADDFKGFRWPQKQQRTGLLRLSCRDFIALVGGCARLLSAWCQLLSARRCASLTLSSHSRRHSHNDGRSSRRQLRHFPAVALAASKTGKLDCDATYDAPLGYRWASRAEVERCARGPYQLFASVRACTLWWPAGCRPLRPVRLRARRSAAHFPMSRSAAQHFSTSSAATLNDPLAAPRRLMRTREEVSPPTEYYAGNPSPHRPPAVSHRRKLARDRENPVGGACTGRGAANSGPSGSQAGRQTGRQAGSKAGRQAGSKAARLPASPSKASKAGRKAPKGQRCAFD